MWSRETLTFYTCTYKISGPIYKMTAVKKADGEHPGRKKEIKERDGREYKCGGK